MSTGRRGETSSKKVGLRYEETAAEFLKTRGFQILEKNFRCPGGEIDLIAREGDYLCFVEVKFRTGEELGGPLEAVDKKKQRRISKASLYYLMRQGLPDTTPCRYDVVAIRPEKITLIRNAFLFYRKFL